MVPPEAPEFQYWRPWAVFALGVLKWPPPVFWAATPGEVRLAAAGLNHMIRPSAQPLGNAELDVLRHRFPDH